MAALPSLRDGIFLILDRLLGSQTWNRPVPGFPDKSTIRPKQCPARRWSVDPFVLLSPLQALWETSLYPSKPPSCFANWSNERRMSRRTAEMRYWTAFPRQATHPCDVAKASRSPHCQRPAIAAHHWLLDSLSLGVVCANGLALLLRQLRCGNPQKSFIHAFSSRDQTESMHHGEPLTTTVGSA